MSNQRLAGRSLLSATLLLTGLAWCTPAWGWGGATHKKMVSDATQSLGWLDSYGALKPTPFADMVRDVLGSAKPVAADAFKFKDAKTRSAKREAYLSSTQGITDPALRSFAQHLLLSSQIKIGFTLNEQNRAVSARDVLSTYAAEPDAGMDKGLDASRDQRLMGGTDGSMTSSQGFRHMSFLLGKLGEGPKRAQLFFDLGKQAVAKGHAYWGFRLAGWGLHYLEDMGTPVHTNILPSLKYIRLKGLVRPVGADGKRHFNRNFLSDLVRTSGTINGNYHFLYEQLVERTYSGGGADEAKLSTAVASGGRGWLRGPKTVAGVAKRRAWSRLSTPGIIRNTMRYFTSRWRRPAPGAPGNTVAMVSDEAADGVVAKAASRMSGEKTNAFRGRLTARDRILASTAKQFRKNGIAIRRAMEIFHRDLPR